MTTGGLDMSLYINPEKILTMLNTMAKTHRGEILSAYVDYQKIEMRNPRYSTTYDELVPYIVIDFK